MVQIFAFFEGRAVNTKIKTGRNSHAPVFHMQRLWWVWFLGIETLLYFTTAGSEAIPRKFPTIYGIVLSGCWSWIKVLVFVRSAAQEDEPLCLVRLVEMVSQYEGAE